MKALVKTDASRSFACRDVPMPDVGPRDVLFKVRKVAICGTDINWYLWNDWAAATGVKLPFIPGHECAAEVVDVGKEVKNIRVGDRIAVETHIPCGNCFHCHNDLMHICAKMKIVGATYDGCFAEYGKVPEVSAVKAPDALTWEQVALLEPLGVALRGPMHTPPVGESVVVVGCGAIGQLAVCCYRAFGATTVIALDVNEQRLAKAKELGAHFVINSAKADVNESIFGLTQGLGAGIVLEASGNPAAIVQAFGCLRKGGTVFMVGMPKQSVTLDVMRCIVNKEAAIKGFHGRLMYKTWTAAVNLTLQGVLDPVKVLTASAPMSDFEAAFERMANGTAAKIMLEL